MTRNVSLPLTVAVVLLATGGRAEEQSPPIAYIDPATVDADFAVQGEYSGELLIDGMPKKVGVQVIAQGDGAFRSVGFLGGLPGDGWDGSDRHEGTGETKNGVTRLRSDEAQATVIDGVMTVTDRDGSKLGELKRIIRQSPTLGATPPEGAVVLFDGKGVNRFPLRQGATSDLKFQSGTLHLEFLLSYMPKASGQQRANSGCYLQGRYEVQILDSFGLAGKHNECGGIYSVKDPEINMCFPPLSWQTYDIEFTAAKYDAEGKKTADARMTVKHNGVLIHRDVAVPHATTAAPLNEGPEPGPIYLQDHGNPIRFRNIWFVEK
jgi:hypothetical protein